MSELFHGDTDTKTLIQTDTQSNIEVIHPWGDLQAMKNLGGPPELIHCVYVMRVQRNMMAHTHQRIEVCSHCDDCGLTDCVECLDDAHATYTMGMLCGCHGYARYVTR